MGSLVLFHEYKYTTMRALFFLARKVRTLVPALLGIGFQTKWETEIMIIRLCIVGYIEYNNNNSKVLHSQQLLFLFKKKEKNSCSSYIQVCKLSYSYIRKNNYAFTSGLNILPYNFLGKWFCRTILVTKKEIHTYNSSFLVQVFKSSYSIHRKAHFFNYFKKNRQSLSCF